MSVFPFKASVSRSLAANVTQGLPGTEGLPGTQGLPGTLDASGEEQESRVLREPLAESGHRSGSGRCSVFRRRPEEDSSCCFSRERLKKRLRIVLRFPSCMSEIIIILIHLNNTYAFIQIVCRLLNNTIILNGYYWYKNIPKNMPRKDINKPNF